MRKIINKVGVTIILILFTVASCSKEETVSLPAEDKSHKDETTIEGTYVGEIDMIMKYVPQDPQHAPYTKHSTYPMKATISRASGHGLNAYFFSGNSHEPMIRDSIYYIFQDGSGKYILNSITREIEYTHATEGHTRTKEVGNIQWHGEHHGIMDRID